MNALELQKLDNANFTHFFTRPLGENYSNSSFDKSKGLKNQEKMNSICSNHIFEPTLSNHFLQIDVDLIENSLHALYRAAPSGDRLARWYIYKVFSLKILICTSIFLIFSQKGYAVEIFTRKVMFLSLFMKVLFFHAFSLHRKL